MIDFRLTEEQKDWFGNRIKESHTGRVIVAQHLVEKFRKLSGDYTTSKEVIKNFLIDQCY